MARILSEDELAAHEARLTADGYTIVEHLLSRAEVAAIAAGAQPLQDAAGYGDNDFTGFKTRRVSTYSARRECWTSWS